MRTDKTYRILFYVNKYNVNENTWLAANSSEQINRMITERLSLLPIGTWWKAIVFSNGYLIEERLLKQAGAIMYRQNPHTLTFVNPNPNGYLVNNGTFVLTKTKLAKEIRNEISK